MASYHYHSLLQNPWISYITIVKTCIYSKHRDQRFEFQSIYLCKNILKRISLNSVSFMEMGIFIQILFILQGSVLVTSSNLSFKEGFNSRELNKYIFQKPWNNKKLAYLQATHVLKPQFKRFFLSLTTTKNVKTKWRTKIFVHSSWLQLKMFIFYFYHSEFFSFNV